MVGICKVKSLSEIAAVRSLMRILSFSRAHRLVRRLPTNLDLRVCFYIIGTERRAQRVFPRYRQYMPPLSFLLVHSSRRITVTHEYQSHRRISRIKGTLLTESLKFFQCVILQFSISFIAFERAKLEENYLKFYMFLTN